jgi:hypothetical protein
MSDSEDSLLDSAYEKLVESSSTVGAGIKKKKAFTTTIVKWPCITHVKVNADGKKIFTHPFLSDDNVYDKLVITHLVVDEPFLAGYDTVAQAWKTSAANMNKDLELPSTNSTPISFPAINAKTIKTRFDAYMKFVANKKSGVPFNSGCDDEEEPCDIQFAIEEMHKKYTSFLETKDSDKQNAAATKKKEMAAAEIICRASLGMKPSEEEVEDCGYGKNKKKKSRVSADGTGGSGGGGGGGGGGSGISSLQDSMDKHSDIMLQKIAIKKHKLELYQQRMALEEKKLNADIKNTEAMHALLMKLANKMD